MNPLAPFELLESPPYCPNSGCRWHSQVVCAAEGRFIRHGSRPVTRYPYFTRRFICKSCGAVFSDSVFYLFYRDRTEPTYERIFQSHVKGQSRRDLARELGCSPDTIQRRFQELARQGLLIQAAKTRGIQIDESVAYDGVENFAGSQFDPNNINHVVGRKTFFLYDFNFSPLNRKGRMSPSQRLRDRQLANKHGRYPAAAIRQATGRILQRLMAAAPQGLIFHSDNHYAYREAIRSLPAGSRLEHIITSAKLARNYRNKLFAINHLDLLTRQQLTTFKRETIAFAKHSIGMIESFSILMVWKNFMRPIFVKPHKRDPLTNKESPAMRVGIENNVLKFREFYRLRLMPSQVQMNEDWAGFVRRIDPSSRVFIRPNH